MKNNTNYPKIFPNKIYLFDDFCVLEVIREKTVTFHKILTNGENEIVENYQIYITQPPIGEDQYLDTLSLDQIQAVNILVRILDYDELIGKTRFLLQKMENYKREDFDMQMAYILEDIKDSYLQTSKIDDDMENKEEYQKIVNMFNDFFYERKSEISEEELTSIKSQLFKIIKTLEFFKGI